MDKFLQQFKDNLENQPLPDFDTNDWNAMQQKLEATPISTPSKQQKLWWVLAALFLLSALSHWLIFDKLQEANEKIDLLSQKRDTLVQKEYIYQIDTIYQMCNGHQEDGLRSNSVASIPIQTTYSMPFLYQKTAPFFQDKSAFRPTSLLHGLINENGSNALSNLLIHSKLENQLSERKKEEAKQKTLLEEWQNMPLQKLATRNGTVEYDKSPILPLSELQPAEMTQKKTLTQRLYPLRPKGLAVGGQWGQAYYLNIFNDASWNYGLSINVSFSNNLQMWLSGQNQSIAFEAEDFNSNYGIPMITPPNDDFELKEIKGNRQFWQFEAGMQYLFNTEKMLQPLVGIGFSSSRVYRNTAEYEFENELLDEEWEDSRTLMNGLRNFGVFKSGLSYQITPHWSGRVEGIYHLNLNNPDQLIPDNLGWRTSIFYSF